MRFFFLLLVMWSTSTAASVDVVALTILGESRSEGQLGMLAVANVIVVRGIEKGLPASQAPRVCLEPKQFSYWNKPYSIDTKTAEAAYAYELASKILQGIPIKNVTDFANHYHSKSCRPSWANSRKVTRVIGNHIFYRL